MVLTTALPRLLPVFPIFIVLSLLVVWALPALLKGRLK
jgi:hypothetical protein